MALSTVQSSVLIVNFDGIKSEAAQADNYDILPSNVKKIPS